MRPRPVAIGSMRLWLQSTTLLAVLAGYAVLLLFNQHLASVQRQQRHEQVVSQVLNELRSRPLTAADLRRVSTGFLAPGVRLRVEQAHTASGLAEPRTSFNDTWLSSATELQLPDGQRIRVHVEQDVTESLEQQWMAFWLLVVAAGLSSLFTGLLLRLVLRRGLTLPLASFSQQIAGFQSPPRSEDRVDLAAQPVEIQPIGAAFNALQDRLQLAWEQQRTFMDGVAHELRTPITLISGQCQSLLRRGDSLPSAPTLELIRREADQMGVLVSDLLDLARRDSGHLHLKTATVLAEEVLLHAYERLEPRADGRLQIKIAEAMAELSGQGDEQRLAQCLTVLVDNALHYTPSGEMVTLSCSAHEPDGFTLHVLDRGPGVPAAERAQIFGRFTRGSAGLASEWRGSGLGLALVKLLMEAMGGSVAVTDRPGGGADFQLHLPGVSASDHPHGA
ncbi:MAG: sensor histidine kinase [Vulcanococcus sp.]